MYCVKCFYPLYIKFINIIQKKYNESKDTLINIMFIERYVNDINIIYIGDVYNKNNLSDHDITSPIYK